MRVGVRADDRETLELALERLPPGWSYAASPAVDRLWSLIGGDDPRTPGVRRLSLLYADAERLARSSRFEDVLARLEDDAAIFVAERASGRLFVHAAVVGWRGSAILLPGPSRSGKTTLVRELVRAGADYYSDEFAPLDRRGRVHPYPRPLTVRDREAGRPARVEPEELGGAIGRVPLPVGLVVLTRYEEGADWSPRPLSPGKAVLGLLANTVAARRDPELALATSERIVRGARALEGARGEARAAAARVIELMEGMARSPEHDSHAAESPEKEEG